MRTALTATALLAISSAAFAAEPVKVSLEPYARHAFESDFEDENTSLSVSRAGLEAKFDQPFSQTTFGRLKLLAEYSHYDFDAADQLLDDGVLLEVRPSLVTYLNKDLNLYGGLLLGATGEPDADVGDSLYYGGFVGFSYQVSPNVWIGTGVGVQTQLEDSPLIVPLLTLEWDITDRLNLSADGLGATLTYELNDAWSIYLDGRYENRQYRLADDNAALPDGVLRDDCVPISVGVTYRTGDNLSLSVGGGVVVWRRIELHDDDENEVATSDVDPAGFVSVNLKWAF